MDPNFTAYLTQPQRHDDRLEHEFVTYRAPDDHVRRRLNRSTRNRLSALFLAIGTRLSAKSPTATQVDPTVRTR